MSEAALIVSKIRFQMGKRVILDEINFSILKGRVFAVVGHNGAGKTTLFHLILGLKIQNEGEIALLGESNLNWKARRKLAYVPERPYLSLSLTLQSFLSFHAKLNGIPSREQAAETKRVAEAVGLEANLSYALSTFSKGMLQKSLLAQAMIGNPEILLLDEPMSGLDPEARESVRQRIIQWKNEGKTIVFSSHALEDVEQLSDEVLILKEGKIQFLGSVKEWGAQR